ncbi:unnamed protein product [Lampetra fluviatilis]
MRRRRRRGGGGGKRRVPGGGWEPGVGVACCFCLLLLDVLHLLEVVADTAADEGRISTATAGQPQHHHDDHHHDHHHDPLAAPVVSPRSELPARPSALSASSLPCPRSETTPPHCLLHHHWVE